MSIILTDRQDRLGSNFYAKVADYIYGHITDSEIYHHPTIRFENSIFTKPFIELSKIADNEIKTTLKVYDDFRGHPVRPVTILKQDLITYFKQHLYDKFMNIISNQPKVRNYKLPWKNNSNIIAIHLRCDDRWNIKDYNGTKSATYLKHLIETDNFDNYDKLKKGYDRQVPISPIKFYNLVAKLKKLYPRKHIYVVHYGRINIKIKKISQRFKIKLVSHQDPDLDLWLLINSEILVLSKSTFSLVAGYLHKGSKVYYPLWGTFTAHGLWTKYDKSGWISYV